MILQQQVKSSSFHYKFLKISLHHEVYEPAEDTFLLLESIDTKSNDTVYEIGTGTGIIALTCAQCGAQVICSDINPQSIKLAKKNVEQNKKQLKGTIEIRKGSLFTILNNDEQFSLIIFNPPYLPTSKKEIIGGSGWFDKAVSGGPAGLTITTEFLKHLPNHLRDNGRAYIIISSNSPRNQLKQVLTLNFLKNTIINSQSFIDETIEVHKITKNKEK